jgi:hypothetical protein
MVEEVEWEKVLADFGRRNSQSGKNQRITRTFPSDANFAVRGRDPEPKGHSRARGIGMERCGRSGARRGATERMVDLSRGSGRLQRRVLELLEQSPERKSEQGTNRSGAGRGRGVRPVEYPAGDQGPGSEGARVGFTDRRHKKDSVVLLPREVRYFTETRSSVCSRDRGQELSRGPGALQRRILDELVRAPYTRLAWTALKKASPARPRSGPCTVRARPRGHAARVRRARSADTVT